MILGKIWQAIAAQFNKLANAIRGYDPIAEMQYEYDSSLVQIREGREGLAQYRAMVERVLRQVEGARKQVAGVEARIKAYLAAGDRETAGRLALDLKRAKDDLAENEKQLALHEQAYQNNLLKIQHAVKKLDEVKHKIGKYDADLKMSRAEAEMAQLANQFHFDVTTDFGQAEQAIQDQIDRNRGRVRVAADLSGEGVEEIQQDMAVEKAMAENALREFEKQEGLVTPETVKPTQTAKELGPAAGRSSRSPRSDASRCPKGDAQASTRGGQRRRSPLAAPTEPHQRTTGTGPRTMEPPGSRRGPASSPTCITPARPACSCCTATSTTWSGWATANPPSYGSLPEFLATQLFGSWDLVLRHDLGQGLRLFAGSDADRLRKMAALALERIGEPKSWPRDPDAVLGLLDQLVRQMLMEEDPARQVRLGVILEYAQFLVPSAEIAQMAGPQGTRLVRLLSSAQNPYIKRHNIAFCLLCDHLAEINERLVASSHVATLAVPMPDAPAREQFAARYDARDGTPGNLADFTPAQLAELTSGLNLVNLERLLAAAARSGKKLDAQELKKLKKGLIERQARGLVEFVEPPHSLDDFVGNDAVKRRLTEDAALLLKGRLDAAAMGYLICGPGRHGQDLPGRVLRRLGGHPLREAAELPVQVRRRDRGEPGADPHGPAGDGAGGRGDRRGRRRARQSRGGRRLRHLEPGLLDDRLADGRHAIPRQAGLDAADQPARPAADRPEAPGAGRGPPAALLPPVRRRGGVHDPRHGKKEPDEPGRRRPARPPGRPGPERGRHREHRALGQAPGAGPRTSSRSAATTSPRRWRTSSRRPRGWRRRSRSWRPCWNAPRCRSCPRSGGRASPSPRAAPGSRSAWPRSAGCSRNEPKLVDEEVNPRPTPMSKANAAGSSTRTDWLDTTTQTPLIGQYAERLGTFLEAMADGRIEPKELEDQEARVVALMKSIEPKLDGALHEEVTHLLCELSAYNIMHTLHKLVETAPKTRFRG